MKGASLFRPLRELRRARAFDHAETPERRREVRGLLDRVLRAALDGSPFYAERAGDAFRRALAAPTDDAFFRAFTEVPALTKGDLADRFDAICTDPEIRLEGVRRLDAEHPNGDATITTRRGTYNVKKTSGTSGKLVYQVDTLAVQREVGSLLVYRALLRTLAHGGAFVALVPKPRRAALVVFVHRGNRSVYQGATSQGAPAWARALLDIHVVAHDASLEAILAEVDRIAPAFLFGLPSRLEWLAMAQLGGRLHIRPTVIFVGGETLHASLVDLYKRAWPACRIVNTYGTTETKAIATACPECGELHVCEDIVHFELQDERGAPCAPGAEAHAVFATSLRNLTVPVIRYEITDRIVALPDAGCRWRTQRIQVQGREPAFLWVKSAREGTWKALNGRMLKESLTALDGACGFAVKHPEADRLDVTIVVIDASRRDRAVASAREAIDRFVREHGCETSDVLGRIDLQAVDADEWNRAGGKLQSIVSAVEPPELAGR